MTFYVRIVRQLCPPALRYAIQLPVEIFNSARIDNPEFAVAFTLPGAVILCEPNQLEKWTRLVAEFSAQENATDARGAPAADTAPPEGGDERSE